MTYSDDSIIQNLINLGLKPNVAKIYKSLIKFQTADAKKLVEDSGVPRSKFYALIKSLNLLGLIDEQKIEGGITKYKVLNFKKGIEKLKDAQLDKINQINESTTIVVEDLMKLQLEHFNEDSNDQVIWILKGTNKILLAIDELLQQAKERIIIRINNSQLQKPILKILSALKQKDLIIHMIQTPQEIQEMNNKIINDSQLDSLNEYITEIAGLNPSKMQSDKNSILNRISSITSSEYVLKNIEMGILSFLQIYSFSPTLLLIDPDSQNVSTLVIIKEDNPTNDFVAVHFSQNEFANLQGKLMSLFWHAIIGIGGSFAFPEKNT